MKTIFIAALISILPISAIAGGVSGGGGNSKPANPIEENDILIAMIDARRYVAPYFNFLEWTRFIDHHWPSHKDLQPRLYDGERTITDWIMEVPITLKKDGPCLDPDGNEMDGSATINPPMICLSEPRMLEKLSKENVRSQILALMVHEYSHLAGATEEEADYMQTRAVQSFIQADFHQLDRRLKKAEDIVLLVNILGVPELWDEPPKSKKEWADFYTQTVERIGKGFYEDAIYDPSLNILALWGLRTYQLFTNTTVRLELARQGTCVIGKGKGWKKCLEQQNQIFQKDKEITYATYMIRTGHKPGDFRDRPGLVFRRIQGLEDARVEFGRLAPEALVYYRYLEVLHDREGGGVPPPAAIIWSR